MMSRQQGATSASFSRLSPWCTAFLGIAIAWLLLVVLAAAASQNLLFDGAMNLEVSRSLAEGQGPRRLYDFNDYFPHGVQTKEPYVLLGALVFKLFGVGPFQTQLPNVLFLLSLCLVFFIAIRRFFDSASALTAILLLLSAPLMLQYGLNGYGELPTLAFGVMALALVSWPGAIDRTFLIRCLFAGLAAGMALATKTVGAILVCAVGLTLLIRVLAESDRKFRWVIGTTSLFVLGAILPLALVELWRLATLGQDGYLTWWRVEREGILYQAGVGPTTESISLYDKVSKHFSLLAREIGRSNLATFCLLATPLLYGLARLIRQDVPASRRWWLLGLLAVATCYVIWWMAITPTEKAWLRRIYIGLVCLSSIGAIALVESLRMAVVAPMWQRKLVHLALGAILVFTYAPFVYRAFQSPVSFKKSDALVQTIEAASLVKNLGEDDFIFAYGWYAAPTVALYSGMSFIDLSDWPIGLYPGHRAYLVADRATFVVGALDPILARYPNRRLLNKGESVEVYEIDFSRPRNPFMASRGVTTASYVNFLETEYGPMQNILAFEKSMGGRWIESDSEILLRYGGESNFELHGYMALPQYYRLPGPLSGRVVIQGCPSIPFSFKGTGWETISLPLKDCQPLAGQNVRVRVLLNNAFDLPLVYDHQRAMLLQSIGFR